MPKHEITLADQHFYAYRDYTGGICTITVSAPRQILNIKPVKVWLGSSVRGMRGTVVRKEDICTTPEEAVRSLRDHIRKQEKEEIQQRKLRRKRFLKEDAACQECLEALLHSRHMGRK